MFITVRNWVINKHKSCLIVHD